MSKKKLRYADIDLHELVTISKIHNSILPPRDNFSKVVPVNNGSLYSGYRYGERVIKVEIGIPTINSRKLEEVIYKLSYALNVDCPSQLILDDDNKIYYAVIDGSTDIERLMNTGKTTLNFICHDPVAYDKKYTSAMMTTDMLSFNFNDMGTYSSYPIIGFEFNKPSTFIYLTRENGEALMVGSIKDDTIPTKPESLRLIDDSCEDSSTFTDGGNVTVSDNRIVDGNYGVGLDGSAIIATSYGSDISGKWVGPTFRKNINQNLDQFEVRVNFSFSSQGENFTPLQIKDLVRVARKSGTYFLAEPYDGATILDVIPYGTDLVLLYMGNNAFAKVRYKNKVAWINCRYVWRINIKNNYDVMIKESVGKEYADEQMGLVEAVGYDNNGQILFRFHLRDNNKYFEHVIPEVYIKDKLYLSAGHEIPTPNTMNSKDDEGKPIGEIPVASGVFGEWNDFTGTFAIRRKKLSDGKYRWWARISRTDDGVNITQEIHMGPGVIDDKLPKTPLNHIVFYIAKYDGSKQVSVMSVNHIGVIDISKEDGLQEQPVNKEIFQPGDYLEIDHERCKVTLNGQDFIEKLDIGSTFFDVVKGSRIMVRTDDDTVVGNCCYRKRYI